MVEKIKETLEDLFFLSINDEDVLNDMGGIIEEFKGGKNE